MIFAKLYTRNTQHIAKNYIARICKKNLSQKVFPNNLIFKNFDEILFTLLKNTLCFSSSKNVY